MNDKVKCGLITGFLGETKDRFRSYNSPKTIEEKFKMVSDMEGVDGVEIVFPYEVSDAAKIKKLAVENNLNFAAVNVNIKADDDFLNGGISSEDKGKREKAIQFIKDAKDFAEGIGADKVQCCPLGDGYEFHFHYDYANAWKYMVEGFGEAGEYKPEIPLFIEYKPNEVRGRCFINSAAKTLCLLNDIGNKAVGTTLDFGHSRYGDENPAEALSLLANAPYPYYIHINDNDGHWDWDYPVATHNYLAYVEFLFYLQEYGYDDYLTSDTSPTRWDIMKVFEANARWTNKIWKNLNSIDKVEFKKLIHGGDFMKTWAFIEANIFFPGGDNK